MEFVTCVLNAIFRLGKVPEMFKLGYITPIYKKHGKPIHDPNSSRRITITNLIGKILEKYILQTGFAEIEHGQNPVTLIREINLISRNQLTLAKSTCKINILWQMYIIIVLFSSKKVNRLMGGTLSQNNKF